MVSCTLRCGGRDLSCTDSLFLHVDLLLHQLDRRLRNHQGYAKHDDPYGLGNVPPLRRLDLHRRGVCIFLYAGVQRPLHRVYGRSLPAFDLVHVAARLPDRGGEGPSRRAGAHTSQGKRRGGRGARDQEV